MELRQLQHFLAVAEDGNFHRAAERVHLTQQAVSRSIAQLEAKLGVRLFDRTRQSVALTPFGELLIPHAKSVDAEISRFQDSLAVMLGIKTGIVKVGATPTTLSQLVPDALARLTEKRPRIQVHVERGDFEHLAAALLRGRLDVIVSTEPDAADPLIAIEKLCDDHNVIVGRAGHPLAKARATRAKDLAGYPWLAMTHFPKAEQDLKAVFGADKLKPPHPQVSTTSVVFAVNWLERSDALAMLPRRLISREIENGRVAEIATAMKARRWPLVVAYRRNATRSPATLALIEAIKQTAD